MLQKRTVGIIGINGKYGQWLKRFFENHGCTVIGSDVGTPLTNQQVVEQAEVVVFSVTLRFATQVISELIAFSRPEQLWLDVTSIKFPQVKAMLQSQAEVIGLHPMCAPTEPTLRGQTIVFCEARVTDKWRAWVFDLLKALQAKIKDTMPDNHDFHVSIVQAGPHAVILSMAAMIRRMSVRVQESLEFTSPFYKIVFSLMGRILGQNPDLYADIQMENPHTLPMLEELIKELQRFRRMVKQKDRTAFVTEFVASRNHFGKHVAQADRFFAAQIKLTADLSNENSLELLVTEDRPGVAHKLTGIWSELGINLTSFHTQPIAAGQFRFFVGFDLQKDSAVMNEACRRISEIPGVEIVV